LPFCRPPIIKSRIPREMAARNRNALAVVLCVLVLGTATLALPAPSAPSTPPMSPPRGGTPKPPSTPKSPRLSPPAAAAAPPTPAVPSAPSVINKVCKHPPSSTHHLECVLQPCILAPMLAPSLPNRMSPVLLSPHMRNSPQRPDKLRLLPDIPFPLSILPLNPSFPPFLPASK